MNQHSCHFCLKWINFHLDVPPKNELQVRKNSYQSNFRTVTNFLFDRKSLALSVLECTCVCKGERSVRFCFFKAIVYFFFSYIIFDCSRRGLVFSKFVYCLLHYFESFPIKCISNMLSSIYICFC